MEQRHDIEHLSDIQHLVDTFYANVQQDEVIGPIFNEKIQDRWPEHLEKMYRFWQTILLDTHTYSGSPFAPHARLPIFAAHFDQWLSIFNRTVDELFIGEKANEAKWRAYKMAVMFNSKLEYFRAHDSQFPIQ